MITILLMIGEQPSESRHALLVCRLFVDFAHGGFAMIEKRVRDALRDAEIRDANRFERATAIMRADQSLAVADDCLRTDQFEIDKHVTRNVERVARIREA